MPGMCSRADTGVLQQVRVVEDGRRLLGQPRLALEVVQLVHFRVVHLVRQLLQNVEDVPPQVALRVPRQKQVLEPLQQRDLRAQHGEVVAVRG